MASSRAASQPVGDLTLVARWLVVLWAIFIVDLVLTVLVHGWGQRGSAKVLFCLLGVWPRELWGLVGVVGAPFVHADLGHITGNSLALLLCGWLACRTGRGLTAVAVVFAMLCSGMLAWLIGSPGTVHGGASGVIFGLVAFLLANAVFRRGWVEILVAVPVAVIYGGALGDMVPGVAPVQMSWQMHLGGFIGGLCASWGLRKQKKQ